jgi:NDP-sugar pyrophosphorylase family protein
MRAMILAAGLGTRLRPLTDDRPKALVEIVGRTLLEITLARLRSLGISEVIVNAHHFADMIVDYLKAHNNFGMRIEVSREEELLDTGGGLKRAADFFLEDSSDDPFVVHNVDVLSSIDLRRMLQVHCENEALVTLAVQQRESSRQLLFDDHLLLCGRKSRDGDAEIARASARCHSLAFCGIHVISPRIFSLMTEEGVFPIVPVYLRLAAQGEKILAFRADQYYWRDLGRPETLRQAEQDLRQGVLPL